MNYKLCIYSLYNEDCIFEKEFDNPSEIKDLIDEFDCNPARLFNLETNDIILEGPFDEDFLCEEYYE